MSDFKSLFMSDEFRAYRRKQVELIARDVEANVYRSITAQTGHFQHMSGKMQMAQELLRLPNELTEDEGLQAILDRQLADDMAYITQYLIRRRFNVEL